MKHKDSWLLGLFTLAYLYLDTRSPSRPPAKPAARMLETQSLSWPEEAPTFPAASLGVVPRSACPRNLTHRVSLRGDGAMWCLACDEGFYPVVTIWGSLTGGLAA